MLIHKITNSVDYNMWLNRLFTKLNKPSNQNLFKFPKLVIQRIRKHYYKTLGTSGINSPFSIGFIYTSIIKKETVCLSVCV